MHSLTSSYRPIALRTGLLLSAVLLSACSQFARIDQSDELELDDLHNLTSWRIEAKLGIRTPKESKSAFVNWQHYEPDYRIELFGPFGKGRVVVSKSGQYVTYKDAEQTQQARNAEALFTSLTGYRVPIDHARYWIRGLPAPGQQITSLELNEHKQISKLTQAGWEVSFDRRVELSNQSEQSLSLPSKIRLSNDDIALTLIVKKWQI